MAKTKVRKASTSISYPFHVDHDLAETLTEQFNSYAMMMEDLEAVGVEAVLYRLQNIFDPEDLRFLLEDDFGRGIVMGQVAVLIILEASSEPDEET